MCYRDRTIVRPFIRRKASSNVGRLSWRCPRSGSKTATMLSLADTTMRACAPLSLSIGINSTYTMGQMCCSNSAINCWMVRFVLYVFIRPSCFPASIACSALVPKIVQSHIWRSSPSDRIISNVSKIMRRQAGTQELGVSCR